MPRFSEEILKHYQEFNNWLTDIFVIGNSPKIVELLVVKNLLKRYFFDTSNHISKSLRKIPMGKIKEIFAMKSKFRDFGKTKCKKDFGKDSVLSSASSLKIEGLEQRMMEEKYLKPLENPTMVELIHKIGCLAGLLLTVVMQRRDPTEEDLNIESEISSEKNLNGFCGFKTQFLQTVMRYCLRQFKSSQGKSINFDLNKKKKVLKGMKTLDFARRIRIGGKTVKNLIVYLSSNGRICNDSGKELEKLHSGKSDLKDASSVGESSNFEQLLNMGNKNHDGGSIVGSNAGSFILNSIQGGIEGSLMGDFNCGTSDKGGSFARHADPFA